MGWAGIENGGLLEVAATNSFDALLTKDANLEYERNLVKLPIAAVVLNSVSNDMEDIRPLVPKLLIALESLSPISVTHVP